MMTWADARTAVLGLVTALSFGVMFKIAMDSMPIGMCLAAGFIPIYALPSSPRPSKTDGIERPSSKSGDDWDSREL